MRRSTTWTIFRVTTPPAPRDVISIEITNHSTTLAPVLKIFDAERRITNWGKIMWEPGSSLQQTIAPAPNTTLYLQVSGYGGSAGAYTLLVRPLKSFDAYEPNDDIYNARRITVGTAVAAGIMDANDTDYYSFVSPRTRDGIDCDHQPIDDVDSGIEHVLSGYAVQWIRSGCADPGIEPAAHHGGAAKPDLLHPGVVAGEHGGGILVNYRVKDVPNPGTGGLIAVQCGMVWLSGIQAKTGSRCRGAALSATVRADSTSNPLRAVGSGRAATSHSRIGWLAWTEPDYGIGGI